MKVMRLVTIVAMIAAVTLGMAIAQAPPAGGQGGQGRGAPGAGGPPGGAPGGAPGGGRTVGRSCQRGPAFNVTSTAWPDGGEVPMKHAGRGENKSPAFEFHWFNGTAAAEQPATVQTFAVIFHDIENFDQPRNRRHAPLERVQHSGDGKGTSRRPCPGVFLTERAMAPASTRGGAGSYFGPGAGAGSVPSLRV